MNQTPAPPGVVPDDQESTVLDQVTLIRHFTLTQADVALVDPGRGRGPR